MLPFLILTHFLVCVLTVLLLSIIVQYLKEKAAHRKTVKDQIQIDIGIVNGIFVLHFSIATIVREVRGPFEREIIVEVIFYVQVSISLLLRSFNFKKLVLSTYTVKNGCKFPATCRFRVEGLVDNRVVGLT